MLRLSQSNRRHRWIDILHKSPTDVTTICKVEIKEKKEPDSKYYSSDRKMSSRRLLLQGCPCFRYFVPVAITETPDKGRLKKGRVLLLVVW